MLDFVSSRKSCYVNQWQPPMRKAGAGDVEKLIEFGKPAAKKNACKSRPHSYHGRNVENAEVEKKRIEKFNGSKSSAQQIASKLFASLNCAHMNAYQTLGQDRGMWPVAEFGAGGGFADISRTWRFHPFKTR